MNEYLSKLYYTPELPTSFGSLEKLYKQSREDEKGLTRGDIRLWLQEQETYTRHRPARRRYKRSRVMAYKPFDLWQADLVDMKALSRYNGGIHYILTLIDCFTKKAFAVPIKRKTGVNVANALKKVFREAGGVPRLFQVDEGTEFLNKNVKKLLDEKKIRYYSTFSDVKASICERFNKTLKNRMYKYFTSANTLKFTDVLPKLLTGYNNAVHRSIGLSPNEVNSQNSHQVFKKLYPDLYKKQKPRFEIGDLVRISYKKRPVFDKGYTPNYSLEVFTISKVKDDIPPSYKLKDANGTVIDGIFFEQELVKVIMDPDNSLFKIEKILKTRKLKGRSKEHFVKWLGYDDSFNSWTSDVKQLT